MVRGQWVPRPTNGKGSRESQIRRQSRPAIHSGIMQYPAPPPASVRVEGHQSGLSGYVTCPEGPPCPRPAGVDPPIAVVCSAPAVRSPPTAELCVTDAQSPDTILFAVEYTFALGTGTDATGATSPASDKARWRVAPVQVQLGPGLDMAL